MSDLLELRRLVNKQYGEGTLVPLASYSSILRIPTGIVDLDIKLGGGIGIGRITSFWGPESSGKTTTALYTCAEAQKLCRYDAKPLGDPSLEHTSDLPLEPIYTNAKGESVTAEDVYDVIEKVDEETMDTVKTYKIKKGCAVSDAQEPMRVLYVNQEGTLDINWARALGVNVEDMLVLDTPNAEHTIDIVNTALAEGYVDLIVVDSIAAMTPLAESEASAEDWQQGLQSRLINKALRIWISSIVSHKAQSVRPTMILINQVRTKIGLKPWMNPDTKPGGKGQDFAVSIDVKLSKGTVDKKTDLATEEEGSHLLVSRTNFQIIKNKTYPSKSTGQYLMASAPHGDHAAGNIIQFRHIMTLAENYGILYKDKSKWVLGEMRFATKKAITVWSNKEPEEYRDFVAALKEHIIETRSGISG
jgi:recombination protein RecA